MPAGTPLLPTAQKRRFGSNCQYNRRFWPPGGQDGLRTGLLAPKTASRRASCLQTGFLARKTASDGPPGAPDGFRTGLLTPRRPPDRPPGAEVSLWTGLLTPQTASDGPSPADKFTCRQGHLTTSPPASQVSAGAKRAFDACTLAAAHAVLP